MDKQKSEEDQRLISVTQDLGVTVRTRAHFLYSKLGTFHVPPKGAICSTSKIEWERTALESWQVHGESTGLSSSGVIKLRAL